MFMVLGNGRSATQRSGLEGENWPGGAPGTDPPKIGVLECARSRAGARSTTWELGTFLLHTNHLRTAQVF